jgi:hypothetical protein
MFVSQRESLRDRDGETETRTLEERLAGDVWEEYGEVVARDLDFARARETYCPRGA